MSQFRLSFNMKKTKIKFPVIKPQMETKKNVDNILGFEAYITSTYFN